MKEGIIICPDCKGEREIIIPFPRNPEKCTLKCPRCHGKGIVSGKKPEWMKKGEILKDRRIEKKLTLRNACRILNMDCVVLSEMERGCREPDMSIDYKEL